MRMCMLRPDCRKAEARCGCAAPPRWVRFTRSTLSSSRCDKPATPVLNLLAFLLTHPPRRLTHPPPPPALQVFAVWSNHLDSARNRVSACKKLDTFKRAMLKCQQDPRTDGLDLLNWLSRPSQHVMRQPLVLGNLLELTPPEHPGHASLVLANKRVNAMVISVDAKKRDYEQRTRLVELYARLRGTSDESDELVQPHRQLLREGELAEVTRAAGASAAVGTGGGEASQTGRANKKAAAAAYPSVGDLEAGVVPSAAGVDGGNGGGGGGGGGGFALRCFGMIGGDDAPRYGLLCNDSFWYCEVLRGNRYNLIHVFLLDYRADAAPALEDRREDPLEMISLIHPLKFSIIIIIGIINIILFLLLSLLL